MMVSAKASQNSNGSPLVACAAQASPEKSPVAAIDIAAFSEFCSFTRLSDPQGAGAVVRL